MLDTYDGIVWYVFLLGTYKISHVYVFCGVASSHHLQMVRNLHFDKDAAWVIYNDEAFVVVDER